MPSLHPSTMPASMVETGAIDSNYSHQVHSAQLISLGGQDPEKSASVVFLFLFFILFELSFIVLCFHFSSSTYIYLYISLYDGE